MSATADAADQADSAEITDRADSAEGPDAVDIVALLADPARRRLYDYVTAQGAPVVRDEAAAGTGLSRSLAAYHLDRLAQAGLLETTFERVNGKAGPGAGRPAKRYTRSRTDFEVSLPPRRYSLLARIIAIAADSHDTPEFRGALAAAAQHEGQSLGAQAPDLMTALVEAGYEPAVRDNGDIVLRNCPFHSVAQTHTELACGLNQSFIEGALCGAGSHPARAALSPHPQRCCVVIHPATTEPQRSLTPPEATE